MSANLAQLLRAAALQALRLRRMLDELPDDDPTANDERSALAAADEVMARGGAGDLGLGVHRDDPRADDRLAQLAAAVVGRPLTACSHTAMPLPGLRFALLDIGQEVCPQCAPKVAVEATAGASVCSWCGQDAEGGQLMVRRVGALVALGTACRTCRGGREPT